MSRPGKRRQAQAQAQKQAPSGASGVSGAVHFRPANAEQARAAEAFAVSDILVLLGGAGTGKTHLALALAARLVLDGKADRVILTRPYVTAGESLGYLKGDANTKMLPFLLPIYDVLSRMTLAKPGEWIREHCEIAPLAYLRGRTFSRCVAVLDEAQNASLSQLKLFVTRLGSGGKLVLAGDHTQADRPDSGLLPLCERLGRPSLPAGVAVCRLDGGVNPRHPLIPELLRRLS